jgi:predicted DNA-binding antitoxin AbrB/MazE fold protein
MSKTIHAIFEKGIFRPLNPVELPESCEVAFEPRLVRPQDLQRVYQVLGERYESNQSDVASRHNEHQP